MNPSKKKRETEKSVREMWQRKGGEIRQQGRTETP